MSPVIRSGRHFGEAFAAVGHAAGKIDDIDLFIGQIFSNSASASDNILYPRSMTVDAI